MALLHATEIPVPGSLPMCIRLLVHAYTASGVVLAFLTVIAVMEGDTTRCLYGHDDWRPDDGARRKRRTLRIREALRRCQSRGSSTWWRRSARGNAD